MAQPITPYLTVAGAAEAIGFYQKAFGAAELMRMPAEDGKRLMHAAIAINGGEVFLSDAFPEYDGCGAPALGEQVPVAIALSYATPAEVDATFQQAVAAGATVIMALEDTFWGDRFGMLRDPYGHRWMLRAPLAK